MQLIVVVSMCNKIRVVKISYSSLLILTNESVTLIILLRQMNSGL